MRHVEHGRHLARALGPVDGSFLDLGSGAGVPGLVLAREWPQARGVLLDAQHKRCRFLRESVSRLGLAPRIEVRCGRAEELAREPELRGQFALVVARSFGRPAVTAECGVGYLAPAGRLVVSEPPVGSTGALAVRWPAAGLARLGLSPPAEIRHGDAGAAVMVLGEVVDDRWPRRVGRPAKSPLW
ncbi:MAG TPA: RsmG family class I SAM-dependent methyltransferase [Acidimicrobiia bacterium]